MKVSELSDADLAYWVGRAAGADLGPECRQGDVMIIGGHSGRRMEEYAPQEDWAQGGPLLDRFNVDVVRELDGTFWASIDGPASVPESDVGHGGQTRLIAAMRCIVRSVYGDSVPDLPA